MIYWPTLKGSKRIPIRHTDGVQLNPDDSLSDVLTIDQAATVVDKAPATLRWWISQGYLVPMRIGRRTFVTGRSVREAERQVWERTARPARPVT